MAETKFIPKKIVTTIAKKTRDIVTATEFNQVWNLNQDQGDHTEDWFDKIYKYFFNTSDLPADLGKISTIDSTFLLKEDKTTADLLCASIEYNAATGVFVFKNRAGTVMTTVDLNIEKIPASLKVMWCDNTTIPPIVSPEVPGWYLVITNSDGTFTKCIVSNLFNPITFSTDNDHIVSFTVTTDGQGNKTVKADVKDGSVMLAHLNSEVLAQITSYTNRAEAAAVSAETDAGTATTMAGTATTKAGEASNSASAASTSETNAGTSATTASTKALVSEGWAVGKQNGIDVTSESPYYHNNAKWYKEQTGPIMTKPVYDTHNKERDIFDYADSLGQKVISISLPTASWVGESSPFTQTIIVTGSTANSKIDLQPDATALGQMVEDGTAAIYVQNSNNVLTAYAIGDKPTADLTVSGTIYEVVV